MTAGPSPKEMGNAPILLPLTIVNGMSPRRHLFVSCERAAGFRARVMLCDYRAHWSRNTVQFAHF